MSKPSLAETHPELAKQWHPTKNGDITPLDVTLGSRKKVWWKCAVADDHEWNSAVKTRTRAIGGGCPYCSGKKVSISNSLFNTNPSLTQEWHTTKNGKLKPTDLIQGSKTQVWWKCSKGDDHEWIATCYDRSRGNGCPICRGLKVVRSNCLATINPHLAKEWHPTKNGNLTPFDVPINSHKKLWWKCNVADDHEWQATSNTRSRGSGCPCCSGRKTVKSNCFATIYSDKSKNWHPTKNGNLTPFDVSINSHKKVWWKCAVADDHEWLAQVADISICKDNGCPCCLGRKVVKSNCLETTHPKLTKQWHPTKNGKLKPFDFTFGSKKKIWWRCDKDEDHEWVSGIVYRHRTNCPYCTLTPQSKQELIITFELKTIFKNIDPKGFKTILDGRLRSIDIFIPMLKLAIEFDGNYWHKDKSALDKIKSAMLMDEGYKVIRIREEPLKKIHENDIISPHPYNGKQITDNIMKRILELYDLDSKARNKIEVYLEKDSLQNEKGLDRYIDQILTEKAERVKP